MYGNIVSRAKDLFQDGINKKNRHRLTNFMPTIIASNCTGGYIYHWLGLEFRSPFINLFMTPEDFIKALEYFEDFMSCKIEEVKGSLYPYPVGKAMNGVLIHFMHYPSFNEAISIWNKRVQRIDYNNLGIILSNWGGEDYEQLKRFDKLPFKHKVVFTDKKYPEIQSAFYLKGYECKEQNVYATQWFTGRRYIDQFNYVDFINRLKE